MLRLIRRAALPAGATGVVALAVLALPAPAANAATPKVSTLSTAYRNPVQVAVGLPGVLVANGTGVYRLGSATAIAHGPSGGEVRGVSFGQRGAAYAFTSATADRSDTRLTIVRTGHPTISASLSAFEKAKNPDGGVTYGVANPSSCVRNAFKLLDGGPANYKGKAASRPYSVAASGYSWYVADAGGNDVVRVDATGAVSKVAVLPPQVFTFTQRLVTGLGLPSCMVGVRYAAEPVPTDVEAGPGGQLYVTTLPGLYDLGQAGSVYRVNPATGAVTRLATGFSGAVNVAVTTAGTVYVAELLTGAVSVLRSGGTHSTLVRLPDITGLDAYGSYLYATQSAPVVNGIRTGPGRVVRIG